MLGVLCGVDGTSPGRGHGDVRTTAAGAADLTGTVSRLVEDHEMIASILLRVAELADQAANSRGARWDAIGRELDGLTAVMDSHFNYEERALSQALDGIPDTGWSDMVFRFRNRAG